MTPHAERRLDPALCQGFALTPTTPLSCGLELAPFRMALLCSQPDLARSNAALSLRSVWRDPDQAWGAAASPGLTGSAWFGPLFAIDAFWERLERGFPSADLVRSEAFHASSLSPGGAPALSALGSPWLILSAFALSESQGLLVIHHGPHQFVLQGERHPLALADPRSLPADASSGLLGAGFGDAGFLGRARLDASLALRAANELGMGETGGWEAPERCPSLMALASFHRAFGYPGPLLAEGQFFLSRGQDARRAWLLAAALSERQDFAALLEQSALNRSRGGRL